MKAASITSYEHVFAPSELVLDERGAAYHIGLLPDEIGDTILVAGDPGRIERISERFTRIDHKHSNREFVAHTGEVNGQRVTALATGIGTDNIDIVLNELDALVNIDLASRTVKKQTRSLKIVRLGTCGAVQEETPVDSLVVSAFACGLDNVCRYYDHSVSSVEQEILDGILQTMPENSGLPIPYISSGDDALVSLLGENANVGITLTASGFYGPQGRQLRLKPKVMDLNERFRKFKHQELRILNYEMETSALYGLGGMMGHQCATICTVIANRHQKTYSQNHHESVGKMIDHVFQKLFA